MKMSKPVVIKLMDRPIKIYLADLAHTHSVKDAALGVPLGIGYIKAYADSQHGADVDISLFKHPEKLLAAVAEASPDIVGLSNYGWNKNLNRAIGGYIQKTCPETLIIAGGPNIDPESDRRLKFLKKHDYIDFMVIDGGEEPFSEMIDWWRDHRGDTSRLPLNIAWQDEDGLHISGERTVKKMIEGIVSPYLSGDLDEFLKAGMFPMLETNRGCPFKCTFCAWGAASKDLVRRFDIDVALAEIDYVGKHSLASSWVLSDANFGILKRDVDIARAIRRQKDERGRPDICQVFVSKNTSDRNIEIAEILGDMTVPLMAVQSMSAEVLKNIRRDNISTEAYVDYQQEFHKLGNRTVADLIVPLPGETLDTHVEAMRVLMDHGVDFLALQNLWLLSGTEINSTKTREEFKFCTRFRLSPGDLGIYRCPDGTELRALEYEESPRNTTTITEKELFFIRRLHFLVEGAWNSDIYKPLLRVGQAFGINPIDVFVRLLEIADRGADSKDENERKVAELFAAFEKRSHGEWFDTAEDIDVFYTDEENFDRLLNEEFEKLYMMFIIIMLRDYKREFDAAILGIMKVFSKVPGDILSEAAEYTFAMFPSLDERKSEQKMTLSAETFRLIEPKRKKVAAKDAGERILRLVEGPKRSKFRAIINESRTKGQTLSRLLRGEGIKMWDLKLSISDCT